MLLFAILVPLCIDDWSIKSGMTIAGLELMCILILAGFWLPSRIGNLAFRGLAALVFLAYLTYLIHGIYSWQVNGTPPVGPLMGFLVIGLPCLTFAALGTFSIRAEPSPEQLAGELQAYEEALLQPDWTFYEHYLKRPIPTALRELYADRDLVTDGVIHYDKNVRINAFAPVNEQCLLDTRERIGIAVLAIARSDCGDPIYLRPGPTERDKIYLTYHDDDKTIVVADSVAAFLEQLRNVRSSSRRCIED